jgi:CheY-like chemotaxis protein
MSVQTTTTATILLVEDDPGHALLIRKNLVRSGLAYDIVALGDGQKAVDYLFKQGEYETDAHEPPPFILLDLNLPVLSGYQVLRIIKNDERTKRIPVVVLTTTDNPQEVARCYELGCNLYVTKPIEYDQFADMIQRLSMFLAVVKAPSKE